MKPNDYLSYHKKEVCKQLFTVVLLHWSYDAIGIAVGEENPDS